MRVMTKMQSTINSIFNKVYPKNKPVLLNLKCSHCDTWTNDVPLKSLTREVDEVYVTTTCGYCHYKTDWVDLGIVWVHRTEEK